MGELGRHHHRRGTTEQRAQILLSRPNRHGAADREETRQDGNTVNGIPAQPPDALQSEEACFVLCTFWLINALILADRAEEACAWFVLMLRRSTPLGLFAEEIDVQTGEHRGNFPEALSHIGVINVAVSLAHVGCRGQVDPHHQAPADAAGWGGSGCRRAGKAKS